MNFDLSPQITRLTPFNNSNGGALAAFDMHFGPIMVRAKLFRTASGYFLSWPSRKSEATEKWYEQVAISDLSLRLKAQELAVSQYEKLSNGELVAV